jgi:hypothetical protein
MCWTGAGRTAAYAAPAIPPMITSAAAAMLIAEANRKRRDRRRPSLNIAKANRDRRRLSLNMVSAASLRLSSSAVPSAVRARNR